jgi:3-hydroxybutyrate dehydrogenase
VSTQPAFASTALLPLEGQTALVTGASRGIGRAIAVALGRAGARVAVAARTTRAIELVAVECGPGALSITLDVTDAAGCASAVAQVEAEYGRLDILVNNAGTALSQKFTDLDAETLRHLFAVDVEGPIQLIQAALPGMLTRQQGTILQLGSIASRIGYKYLVAYCAAKHALLGLTRGLAAEYARTGVTFNCICPAFVDTPMTAAAIEMIQQRTGRSAAEAEQALFTPQGRLIQPDEVAAACVFLASTSGRSITGQAIMIDGGWVLA